MMALDHPPQNAPNGSRSSSTGSTVWSRPWSHFVGSDDVLQMCSRTACAGVFDDPHKDHVKINSECLQPTITAGQKREKGGSPSRGTALFDRRDDRI
jgi:hypothetical protein